MAGPACSCLTTNHRPSKNNSAPCTCLCLHDCIQGCRSIRCCINGYRPKASAKNFNNCSATGARRSKWQNLQQNFLWRFHHLLWEPVSQIPEQVCSPEELHLLPLSRSCSQEKQSWCCLFDAAAEQTQGRKGVIPPGRDFPGEFTSVHSEKEVLMSAQTPSRL